MFLLYIGYSNNDKHIASQHLSNAIKKTINVYPTKMYEKYILLKFHFLKYPKPKQVCINETSENNLSYI